MGCDELAGTYKFSLIPSSAIQHAPMISLRQTSFASAVRERQIEVVELKPDSQKACLLLFDPHLQTAQWCLCAVEAVQQPGQRCVPHGASSVRWWSTNYGHFRWLLCAADFHGPVRQSGI